MGYLSRFLLHFKNILIIIINILIDIFFIDHFECDSLDLADKLNSFCKEIFNIFHELTKGQINLNEFSNYYLKIKGYPCQPEKYGYFNLSTLLGSIPTVVKVRYIKISFLSTNYGKKGLQEH